MFRMITPEEGSIDASCQSARTDPFTGTPMENFDFSGFVLETQDRTKFTITRSYLGEADLGVDGLLELSAKAFGKCKLSSITTRSGEQTLISDQGLKHYSPTKVLTHTIFFRRDSNNRIDAIFGPDSLQADGTPLPNALPAVQYVYASDNLVQVKKLVDKDRKSVV